MNRILVQLDVPDDVWAKRNIFDGTVPQNIGWDVCPAGMVSINFGTAWANASRADGASALLEVPSAIVPEEKNILINPAHPDVAQIKVIQIRKWTYDVRLQKP